MIQDGVRPNRYVCVPIASDVSFNAKIGLPIANELQVLEFCLSRKPKRENFLSLEFTQIRSYIQRITQASHTTNSYKIYMNLTLTQEIMHIEAQLSVITVSYRYDESKLNDKKDDRHANNMIEKDKLGEPINQTTRLLISKFEDASEYAHVIFINWALSRKKSGLTIKLDIAG